MKPVWMQAWIGRPGSTVRPRFGPGPDAGLGWPPNGPATRWRPDRNTGGPARRCPRESARRAIRGIPPPAKPRAAPDRCRRARPPDYRTVPRPCLPRCSRRALVPMCRSRRCRAAAPRTGRSGMCRPPAPSAGRRVQRPSARSRWPAPRSHRRSAPSACVVVRSSSSFRLAFPRAPRVTFEPAMVARGAAGIPGNVVER